MAPAGGNAVGVGPLPLVRVVATSPLCVTIRVLPETLCVRSILLVIGEEEMVGRLGRCTVEETHVGEEVLGVIVLCHGTGGGAFQRTAVPAPPF